MKPIVLCILDGVGIREETKGNAFKQAKKPNFDYLWENYPHSLLEASGELVGLPIGQMGNSEVGHLNIGAGRIVYQPLQLINEKIKNKEFYQNKEFDNVFNHVINNNSNLHILGLLSDGGIHSHINHLIALLESAKNKGIKKVYLHLFLDGRDTLPNVCLNYLDIINEKIKELGNTKIATLSGRYYAMDRDNNWERIKLAYDAITENTGVHASNYKEAILESYKRNEQDEFVKPIILDESGMIKENDGLILFNYRPDRGRELFSALTNENFSGFQRTFINKLKLVTMMPLSEEVKSTPAFKLETLENTLGEFLANNNYKQLRIAETEKYAHVTYFFDGGIEKELKGCTRILVPSPKVATYDLQPEMSAEEVTEKLLNNLEKFDVVILNFANGDMVGHTGNISATIKAVEFLDECLGKIYIKVKDLNGTLIVTADHGNCDEMCNDKGDKITSHSNSKVPFIITKDVQLKNGKLADIAPTIISLLNESTPSNMTGDNLIK